MRALGHPRHARHLRLIYTGWNNQGLRWFRSSVAQGVFQEVNSLLCFLRVTLSYVVEHVLVPLDKDLRVLLSVLQLFISVSLDPSHQSVQMDLLFLAKLEFFPFKVVQQLVCMANTFSYLKGITHMFEIYSRVIVFRSESLFLKVSDVH